MMYLQYPVIKWRPHFGGKGAVEKFRETGFDLLFMDVMMPGISGGEAFFEIRNLSPHVEGAMITGYSIERLLAQATEQSAWTTLGKSFDPERLLGLIRQVTPNGILVTEDDAEHLENIQSALEIRSQKVLIAHERWEAVEGIGADLIDVLLLDMHIPIVCALAVHREVRDAGFLGVTILALGADITNINALDDISAFSPPGMLSKSGDPQGLLRMVENLSEE